MNTVLTPSYISCRHAQKTNLTHMGGGTSSPLSAMGRITKKDALE